MNSSFVPIDEQKLMNFMHKAVSDLGATVSSSLVVVGEKFGFYKAMAGVGFTKLRIATKNPFNIIYETKP